jgi:hypothetical protein
LSPEASAVTRFAGADYVPRRDDVRLGAQLAAIVGLMRDGRWRTLDEISQATGAPPASASAQLRHATKPQHGAWRKEKQHLGGGLFAYRLLPPLPAKQLDLGLGGGA